MTRVYTEKRWTQLFYRMLDSLDEGDHSGQRLVEIESSMFHDKFKPDGWSGTDEENLQADSDIASAIRSSLKQQE